MGQRNKLQNIKIATYSKVNLLVQAPGFLLTGIGSLHLLIGFTFKQRGALPFDTGLGDWDKF